MRRKLRVSCIASSFYIKPQLLQCVFSSDGRCIASSFYIKPQHFRYVTVPSGGCIASSFYIKPQPLLPISPAPPGCIASSFYIKPQQFQPDAMFQIVVLHPLSTSNHNVFGLKNNNKQVVLHPLSTSNHNKKPACYSALWLYCILFLHQTTTEKAKLNMRTGCIASSFYIKPQPRTPDTLIFGHLTASRHDTKRGGVHRGSRFDAVFTFSTNIRKIIFTEIRRCMSVQRAGARLRSDSSEANI